MGPRLQRRAHERAQQQHLFRRGFWNRHVACSQRSIDQSLLPVYFSGSANAPSCISACSLPNFLPYNGLEGFQWSALTIQGARVIDSATGQWKTPDAYAGDIHDLMSQKPFM